ncbi:hypothetical protein BGZ95_000949 [Linnemannia exigua]|uniref:Uncharacterized protein n=1 Tax=Linnemannia exigua TaxID=604196 RepID=A0AAD4HA95_9FUNG|nr:hypothetical protein BGZ95_000949 [Linnemannia exigua]
MSLLQRFRLGDHIELLALRKDAYGSPYSQMTDIQDIFPGALRFKVHGINILFLENEQGQRFEPKRIAYYPDAIIDVVVANSLNLPATPDFSDIGTTSLSTLSLHSRPSANTQVDLQLQATYRNASPFGELLCQPMTALSTIGTSISQLQHQLGQATDQQSDHHRQLQQQLLFMIQQQNAILQELAASKEREEQMLKEQAESKLREEQMLAKQQETVDRLIVTQRRMEAILVQSYELHEYPIPRLFVILPDSYERWDPRGFLAERFRLYFLCECGDHCRTDPGTTTSSDQVTITAASHISPIPVRDSIHLAKHEGYELSRPTEFFDRFGPYVLGMLRILKHCLAVATVVAPAVALADSSVKDVMDGVRSISESTMKSVDMSIDFLEQRLNRNGNAVGDGATKVDAGIQEEDMFNGLVALEGADLRRLNSFLRNKDADKILGNLYRITTDTGHVKWVCLDHYRQVYRETAMSSFLQCVESNGGTFGAQLGKVTISLKSATAAKDFFNRLAQHAPAVTALKVTLDWSFGSADLAMIVDKTSHSNVRDFTFCTRPQSLLTGLGLFMRPGKGRFHSLLGLFSNTKIKGLTFTNMDLIGLQTSSLPTSHSPSFLQSLHFEFRFINSTDDSRVAGIIRHCPHLVDLRLGAPRITGYEVPKIDQAIGSLSKLTVLHRYRLHAESSSPPEIMNDTSPYGTVALRELVDYVLPYPAGPNGLLESAIRRSSDTLEVLMLQTKAGTALNLLYALVPFSVETNHLRFLLPKLTHLELPEDLTLDSVQLMESILPHLPLIHLAMGRRTCRLLTHVNLNVLKSLYLFAPEENVIDSFSRAILKSSSCQIESLYLWSVPMTTDFSDVLSVLPLKRLLIYDSGGSSMTKILQLLNLSQLQVLTIYDRGYDWGAEEALAGRNAEFPDGFLVQLPYANKDAMLDIHKGDARDLKGSPTMLARHRVRFMCIISFWNEYYAITLPTFAR